MLLCYQALALQVRYSDPVCYLDPVCTNNFIFRSKTVSLEKLRNRLLHDMDSFENEDKCLAEYRFVTRFYSLLVYVAAQSSYVPPKGAVFYSIGRVHKFGLAGACPGGFGVVIWVWVEWGVM